MQFDKSHIFSLPSVNIINATPHPLNFEVNGEIVVIPVVDGLAKVITAVPVEVAVPSSLNVELVKVQFNPSDLGLAYLLSVPGGVCVVGSLIAAQAFGSPIVALVPAPGFERVPPDQRRMRHDKFTVF